jgi:hypothetical protein
LVLKKLIIESLSTTNKIFPSATILLRSSERVGVTVGCAPLKLSEVGGVVVIKADSDPWYDPWKDTEDPAIPPIIPPIMIIANMIRSIFVNPFWFIVL